MTTAAKKPKRRKRSAQAPRTSQLLPPADENGYYPAAETLQAIIALQIVKRRKQVALSQADLAKRAGVRQETISRLENGKHSANLRTIEKIDRALTKAGA
jgi:DNA-binding XRE family transcriptional regulator